MEHDNLRAVLLWAIENHNLETACQLGTSLSQFWHLRGCLRESYLLVSRIIAALAEAAGTNHHLARMRTQSLEYTALMSLYLCDYATPQSLLEESLSIAQDPDEELVQLGVIEATVRPPKLCHDRSRQRALPSFDCSSQ